MENQFFDEKEKKIYINKFNINKNIAFVCYEMELGELINNWFGENGYKKYFRFPCDKYYNSLCIDTLFVCPQVGYGSEGWFKDNNYIMIYPKTLQDVEIAIKRLFGSPKETFIFSNNDILELA